jgi:hypothetical protein
MHAIFSFTPATGKFAMGSSDPLGTPPTAPSAEDADTQQFDTIILDEPPEKAADAPEKVNVEKRKIGAFADDELATFNITFSVKECHGPSGITGPHTCILTYTRWSWTWLASPKRILWWRWATS